MTPDPSATKMNGSAGDIAGPKRVSQIWRTPTRTMSAALPIACLGLLFLGCAFETRTRLSVPEKVPEGSSGRIKNKRIMLSLNGVDLFLQAQNFQSKEFFGFLIPIFSAGQTPAPQGPFQLWIELDPTDDTFAFDPGGLKLTFDGGRSLEPVSFFGPGVGRPNFDPSHGLYVYQCGVPRSDVRADALRRPIDKRFGIEYSECFTCEMEKAHKPEGPIPLREPACFVVLFNGAVPPEARFRLSIGGIQQAGSIVAVPDIRFEKGQAIFTDSAP